MGLPAKTYIGDMRFENYNVLQKKSLNFLDPIANSNKYYTIELHECNGYYRVFTDYGRLGVTSTKQVRETDNLFTAQMEFEKILKSKLKKGYKEVELAQSTTGSQKAQELIDTAQIKVTKKSHARKKKSDLDPQIQGFVKQIFDEAGKKLNTLVKGDIGADGASPLGKLSVNQIDKGRSILQEIADVIVYKKDEITINDVLSLSSEYYANIPKVFGRRVTPQMVAIASSDKLSEELDILKFYEDSLRMGNIIYDTENLDKQYQSLNSNIGILDPSSDKYREIVDYVHNSQSNYHPVNLVVKQIFTVNQHKAPEFDDSMGNVKELFHGTRSANMPGILSTHLKLPNQLHGVHITGAMFGPGLYFSSQSTKSSQYSCSRFGGSANKYLTSFMFLADVALGRIKKEEYAKYYLKAPAGYHSVMGVKGKSLLHDEYIIYKEAQQHLRYIIEFKAKSKY
mgnify:CR=1 FL=1